MNITFEKMVEAAKNSFADDPEAFRPYFFVQTPERTMMIPAGVGSEKEKLAMLRTVRAIFAVIAADEYYLITDSYVVTGKPDEAIPTGSLKDVPGRREALSVMRVSRNEGNKATLSPYQRTDYGIAWTDEQQTMDKEVAGSYTELLTPTYMIEALPQHLKDGAKPIIDLWTINYHG